MKQFRWDLDKNNKLRRERGISFEEILLAIERGGLVDILQHPNQSKYPNQKLFVVIIRNYAYLVPFVEDDKEIFLKTVIPSRKATREHFR